MLVVGDDVPAELSALATLPPDHIAVRTAPARKGTHVMVAERKGAFAAARLRETIDDLLASFDSVLVQTRDRHGARDPAHTVMLADGAVDGARVPAFQAADEEALRDGLLPSGTPAGGVLGLVARDVAGLTVGLALGAGSIRGYAHCGVLRALEHLGLKPDYMAGTSVGGCVAGMYAAGSPRASAPTCSTVAEVCSSALHCRIARCSRAGASAASCERSGPKSPSRTSRCRSRSSPPI